MEEVIQKEEKKDNQSKKKKKKVHLKNKKILIPIILLLIVLFTVGGFFGYKELEKNTIRSIRRRYSSHVVLVNHAKLYNKNRKVIGSIQKGYSLDLEKVSKFSLKNTHLKIKDSDYYVYYKDIKKEKAEDKKVVEDYYLPLEKRIETTQEVVLYDGKKEAMRLKNGVKADLICMDQDTYTISLLNHTFTLKKNKTIKEIEDSSNPAKGKADHVSVIYYDKILEDCGGDDTCLRPVSVRAHLNRLKKEGYYFITKDDFVRYINGYVNLKEKALFIAVGTENDLTNKINEELGSSISKVEEADGIKLVVSNKTATPKDAKDQVNCYQAKSYTIIDRYDSMAAGLEVPDNGKENSDNQGIAVLNYHFFYDDSIPGERGACNESICLEREKLKSHLQWLQDNGYKTLTIQEYADWMDGIIEIPDHSVLLTIDDGAHGTGKHNGNVLIPLLEEYKMHATLFLIAGWWDISNYQSPYLDIQSHSFNLHYEASCADGRGMVACSDYQTVKNDLQQSLDVIKDNTSFCFPFYSYDNESLQAIQELGFRMSFVGGSVKSRRSNNHYLIPRYPIMEDITLNDFIWMVS